MKYHDSFVKFWIIKRVKKKIHKIGKKIGKKIHKIGFKFSQRKIYLLKSIGFWYCGDCNKYHSPRVMNFNPDDLFFTDGSCDPEYLEKVNGISCDPEYLEKLKDLEAVEPDI